MACAQVLTGSSLSRGLFVLGDYAGLSAGSCKHTAMLFIRLSF